MRLARLQDAYLWRLGTERAILVTNVQGRMERARAVTERLVGRRAQAAYERAVRPRQQEGPRSIAPWIHKT